MGQNYSHTQISVADLDKILTGSESEKPRKNEVFVHFHSNLEILTGFQKPCDPVWIRHRIYLNHCPLGRFSPMLSFNSIETADEIAIEIACKLQ